MSEPVESPSEFIPQHTEIPETLPKQHSLMRRNSDYRWWFLGDTAGQLGLTIKTLALSYLAFALTTTISSSGVLSSISAVTTTVFSVLGGTIIDRMDRRKAIVIYGVSGALIWGSGAVLLMLGLMTYPILLTLAFAAAFSGGLFGSATNAALRSIVEPREYPEAQAANQGRDGALNVLGSPLGGLLYSLRDWLPFVVPTISYLILVVATMQIRADLSPRRGESGEVDADGGFIADFLAGFRYVVSHKRMLRLQIIVLLLNLGFAGVMQGVFLNLVAIGTPPVKTGILNAVTGGMVLLGALVATRIVNRFPSGKLYVATFAYMLVVCIPLIFSQSYVTVLVCFALLTVSLPIVNSSLLGFIMARVPHELQGRVGAVSIFANILSSFAGAICGWILTISSAGTCVAIFIGFIAAGALLSAASPNIREISTPDRWEEYPL
ncbi:MFS transporter [Arcanobacterium haemolyticum]|nr:MFS transporter [Arcanobacterium haemolyticum]